MPYCVPTCKGCREAGSCPKGELPASAYVPALARKPPRRAAVKATYPHDANPDYTYLVCGHVTDKGEILAYSVWQPKGKPDSYYCGKCGKWVKKIPKPQPQALTSEPMF
jgi:hypothetical protein